VRATALINPQNPTFVPPYTLTNWLHHAFWSAEVVVPLLSMSNSVLLCISTLLESGNHYSSCRALTILSIHCFLLPVVYHAILCTAGKMFDLVDDLGRKLFESIAITLCASPHAIVLPASADPRPRLFSGSATNASRANTLKSTLLSCRTHAHCPVYLYARD
jgi:hypothetical protein